MRNAFAYIERYGKEGEILVRTVQELEGNAPFTPREVPRESSLPSSTLGSRAGV